ncbi:nuclear body protein SP140-like isoform X2 [Grammomys surdaster]|uniref:nuclear body protein SP140-like isoform X2 n=1 Tax=Grammomys surdaster TaxID=491861 RepID=UPI00109F8507|nr:nuclear body protein SP140-like isoform X2 [Grammomys surdaster]
MAGGDNGLSSRTIPEDQNEESDDYQLMFKHFKENKVEIASAITRPFPFLMSLRDRDFISEQKFQECEETCKNLVPVDRVVYDILSEVQKKFSRDLLKVIFSKTHLKAYPDLKETLKHFFQNVSDNHRTHQSMNGRDVEERPRLPAIVREASCSPGNSNMNDEQAEEMPNLPQCNGGASCSPGNSNMNDEQDEEMPNLPQCNGGASCSPGNSNMNNEQAEEMPSLPQCNGGGSSPAVVFLGHSETFFPTEGSTSCEQSCDGQDPQDHLSSSLRREAGAQRPTSEEKCSCVMCSPTYVPEDLGARMGSSQGEAIDIGRSIPARKPKKRRKKKGHNWSKPKWRKPMSVRRKRGKIAAGQAAFRRKKMKKNPGLSAKIRGLRRLRKENANFSAELLPVTCGDLKGVLHKNKFKKGISVMSIQCEDGNWCTPSKFEIMGGYGKSKNWKLSLRCHNLPLKFLIQRNFLPIPPRIYHKRKKRTQNLNHSPVDPNIENSDECEVCRKAGTLFCCDTCSRSFHEECHIPTVEAEITPWSCIFCRIQSLGSQQSLPESEILQREMVPQEQLRCEYVLLRAYRCSESSFFSKMPYYYYFRERAVGVQEPMWLDKIKKKLSDQAYCQVEDFVQDMRLIFRNHRITFKDPKFGKMGLRLESKFETSFKEVFAIQETNEKS